MNYAVSTSQLSNAYNSYPLTIDTNYAIIIVYFIGMFVGIVITIDYYKPLQHKLLNDHPYGNYQEYVKNKIYDTKEDDEQEDKDDEDKDDEDYDPNQDDEQEDNEPEDNEQEDDEQEDNEPEHDEQEDNEVYDLKKETVRKTIDIIYVYTDVWTDFVSKKSIYLRLQNIYPTITKFMIKEAMNMEPRYITGTQYNTGGYRYITEL